MHRIRLERSWPLHDTAASRELERLTQAELPAHTLMQRAGLACARLARAIAPHGRQVWVACGPGNNGGDGFEAAWHLHTLGWQVWLTWTGPDPGPSDAQASRTRALQAGLTLREHPPEHFDLAIDTLLGLGGDLSDERPGSARMRQWLERMHAASAPVLAVDLPTGLHGDTGVAIQPIRSLAPRHTLSLLSLKPGLFTAQGRDAAGQIWLDTLGAQPERVPASAWLLGADRLPPEPRLAGRHASHKGSYGDVIVVGGQQAASGTSMAGAALLAARAALHDGAGRVYVALLGEPGLQLDLGQPELMFRPAASLGAFERGQVVVAGCGGGPAMAQVLPDLLARAPALVLDADGLNAVAGDRRLQSALRTRRATGQDTVLTPHPLEAARLLDCSVAQVQAGRLQSAQSLADALGAVVALKGSGTVIAAPGHPPVINPTGNALLATAGTGDVLAGMVGAAMAQGLQPHQAAMQAVFRHGQRADRWTLERPQQRLTATQLLT